MTSYWGHQDNPFPPDEELPVGCTSDEYGHPIMCEDCIWGKTCIDSTIRKDED